MKKTIKINLRGSIFHIDEDAYETLKKYLDRINKYFGKSEEGEEILNDIEARIAELFLERKPKDQEVVNIDLVNQVIEIMGNPEEIIYGEEAESSSTGGAGGGSGYSRSGSRRLYRDPENTVVGGVCGGLGAYFNVDPILFRILFVVFFFAGGSSLLLYAILWIVLPKAETAGQRLEMRGEPVNVNNIGKKVKEEYETTKENVKKAANSETAQKTKKAASNFFSELGKILLLFVKVILIIIGTALVISGIGIIVGLVTGTFMGLHFFPFDNFDFTLGELLTPFSDPVSIALLIISLSLLFLIPVIAMIYGLIRLIFGIRTRNRGLLIGATTLWVVSLLAIVGILALETGNFSHNGKSSATRELAYNSDTLYVMINTRQKQEFEEDITIDLDLDHEWYMTKDLETIYGTVDLDVVQSNKRSTTLEIEKKSKGKNYDAAEENASALGYNFKLKGNRLMLDPYFSLDGSGKWRFPRVDLTLSIPEGTYIFLEKESREHLDDVYNVEHISDWRMGDKMWYMSEEGLTLVSQED